MKLLNSGDILETIEMLTTEHLEQDPLPPLPPVTSVV